MEIDNTKMHIKNTNTHKSDLLVMQILLRLQKSWEEAVLSSFLRQIPPLSGWTWKNNKTSLLCWEKAKNKGSEIPTGIVFRRNALNIFSVT